MKKAPEELSFTLLLHMGLTVQEPALYSFCGRQAFMSSPEFGEKNGFYPLAKP